MQATQVSFNFSVNYKKMQKTFQFKIKLNTCFFIILAKNIYLKTVLCISTLAI